MYANTQFIKYSWGGSIKKLLKESNPLEFVYCEGNLRSVPYVTVPYVNSVELL